MKDTAMRQISRHQPEQLKRMINLHARQFSRNKTGIRRSSYHSKIYGAGHNVILLSERLENVPVWFRVDFYCYAVSTLLGIFVLYSLWVHYYHA